MNVQTYRLYKVNLEFIYVKSQLQTLLDEGEANYNTRRFRDAAATFERLTRLAVQENEFEDAVYFAYRSILAWSLTDKYDMLVNSWMYLGELAYKYAAKTAIEKSEEIKDPNKRVKMFEKAVHILKHLGDTEKIKVLQKEMISDLITLSGEFGIDPLEREIRLRKAMKILEEGEIGDQKLYSSLLERLAETLEEIGDLKSKDKNFGASEVAIKYFVESLQTYEKIGNKKKVKQVSKKIESLNTGEFY